MAARKRVDLGDILSEEDTAAASSEATAVGKTTAQPARTAARSPRKKSAAKGAKKTAASPQNRTQPAGEPADETAPAGIQVLAIDTATAKRPSLYLHPDDWKALQLAKIDDGADLNARIRAMIAVWRGNKRFAQQVDRLAKTAPRGGY